MKILAFTDIHNDLSALEHVKKEVKEKKIEYVICCGDFTFFDHHLEIMLKKISEIDSTILLIHGNHEYDEVVELLCKKYKNIHYLHKKSKKIGTHTIIGYGGGGFSFRDPEFVHTMKQLTKNIDKKEKIILFTHAPAYNANDLVPWAGHVGNKDYREFIENNNVVYVFHGHIHETFGQEKKIGKARIINPGPKGKIITLE